MKKIILISFLIIAFVILSSTTAYSSGTSTYYPYTNTTWHNFNDGSSGTSTYQTSLDNPLLEGFSNTTEKRQPHILHQEIDNPILDAFYKASGIQPQAGQENDPWLAALNQSVSTLGQPLRPAAIPPPPPPEPEPPAPAASETEPSFFQKLFRWITQRP